MFIFFAKHFMVTEAIKISVGMLNKSEFTVKCFLSLFFVVTRYWDVRIESGGKTTLF